MKKSVIIIFVFIFVLSLSSCGVPVLNIMVMVEEQSMIDIVMKYTTPQPVYEKPEPESVLLPSLPTMPEISSENINQCVEFAVQNGRIYYRNHYDNGNLYRVNTDGGENRKLSDDRITQFFVSDNQIYYENISDSEKLYAMNTDGSGKRKLSDDSLGTSFWNVSGDRIYYRSEDDDSLYSINTDGSDRKELSDDQASRTTISGDRIYYFVLITSERGIYSIKTDGSEKTKLSDDWPNDLTAVDDWVYYANVGEDYKLYAMRSNGSDRRKLTDDYTSDINVAGNRIYYIYIKEGEHSIYSMNMDGSDKQLLSRDNPRWFTIWDGRIYYMLTGANIYSMNLDGSDKQLILKVDQDRYKDVTYEVNASVHEGMPEYRFVATGRTRMDEGILGDIMRLDVFDDNGLSILSADFSEAYKDEVIGSPVYNDMMDTMGLHVVDVNFDGYKDVIILNNFSGTYSNTWYDCWLWDSGTSSFVQSESFSEICNPALDPDKKYICSSGGSGTDYWGGSIYQYVDGEFVMTNNLDTYEGGLVETELVNGKMEVVRQVTYTNEAGRLEAEMEYYKNSELWQRDHPRWYWVGGHQADEWLGE